MEKYIGKLLVAGLIHLYPPCGQVSYLFRRRMALSDLVLTVEGV